VSYNQCTSWEESLSSEWRAKTLGGRLGGLVFIFAGLIAIIFADAIGRNRAKLLHANPRPFQMIGFFIGLLFVLVGILILIIGY
jgi:hypothetical protein